MQILSIAEVKKTRKEFLCLSRQEILSLEPYVFQQLVNLEALYLEWNFLERLEANSLKGMMNLKKLDFCNLDSIYRKIFN